MLPNDFKMRTHYQQGVDWPISYGDIGRWYTRADQEMGVAGNAEETEDWPGTLHARDLVVEFTKLTVYTHVRLAGVVQSGDINWSAPLKPRSVQPTLSQRPEVINAMQPFPKLTPQARQALEIIVGSTAIDGSSLMKKMGVSRPADIVTIIRELQAYELIEVGGNVTAEELPFAQFGVRPSAKEYLDRQLKQSRA